MPKYQASVKLLATDQQEKTHYFYLWFQHGRSQEFRNKNHRNDINKSFRNNMPR